MTSEQEDRAASLLGLARRAGKLTLGAGATMAALSRGSLSAVVLARDLSPGSSARLIAAARTAGVRCYTLGTKSEFGRRFGRQEVGILGLLDESLGFGLARCLGSAAGPDTRGTATTADDPRDEAGPQE